MLAKHSLQKRPAGLVLVFLMAGCHTFHHYESVDVLVRDAETKAPIGNANVELNYLVMLDFFAPASSAGKTDENGHVVLKFAPNSGRMAVMRATSVDHLMLDNFLGSSSVAKDRKKGSCDLVVELFSGDNASVELLVPDGFRGLLKVEISPLDENDWKAGQRLFKVIVPPGGIAELKGPAPLLLGNPMCSGIQYSALFADRTAIPQYPQDDTTVALRYLTSSANYLFFVVGTKKDLKDAEDLVYTRNTDGSVSTNYDKINAWTAAHKRQQ